MSYEARALAAYYRSAAREANAHGSGQVMQPGSVEIEKHGEHQYVVLRNVNGVLAVYRITTQDTLKALKRWPKEINE